MDKKQNYIAIIGDIIQSKQESKRANIQLKLEKTLKKINLEFSTSISANFMITLGDEFQGLLHDATPTMRILEILELALFPVRLRIGIGVGPITTSTIDRYVPLGSDGPAYYYAREMIDYLKSLQRKKKEAQSSCFIRSQHSDLDLLMNSLFSQLHFQKENWTTRQYEIVFAYRTLQNQTAVAKELKITQSTVQKGLAAAGYYYYSNTLNTLQETTTRMLGGNDYELL